MEKEAIIVDLNGNFVDVVSAPVDEHGVFPLYETPAVEPPADWDGETPLPVPEPVLIGYRVSIPRPAGLYAYKWDVAAEEWVEGLTPEEIDAIRNAPRPPSLNEQVEQLQTESVDTMLALTEVYETTAQQDAAHEQESVDTMLALTETYELVLQQQGVIDQQQQLIDSLTARIVALEGGGS